MVKKYLEANVKCSVGDDEDIDEELDENEEEEDDS